MWDIVDHYRQSWSSSRTTLPAVLCFIMVMTIKVESIFQWLQCAHKIFLSLWKPVISLKQDVPLAEKKIVAILDGKITISGLTFWFAACKRMNRKWLSQLAQPLKEPQPQLGICSLPQPQYHQKCKQSHCLHLNQCLLICSLFIETGSRRWTKPWMSLTLIRAMFWTLITFMELVEGFCKMTCLAMTGLAISKRTFTLFTIPSMDHVGLLIQTFCSKTRLPQPHIWILTLMQAFQI